MMNASAPAVLGALVALLAATRGDRTVAIGDPDRPDFVGCQTSEECGKGACCVVGMSRYSAPRCAPRGEPGDGCRPGGSWSGGGSPVATTLHYPHGLSVQLADAFLLRCPCQAGLRCDVGGDSPVCADAAPPNSLPVAEGEVEGEELEDPDDPQGRW